MGGMGGVATAVGDGAGGATRGGATLGVGARAGAPGGAAVAGPCAAARTERRSGHTLP